MAKKPTKKTVMVAVETTLTNKELKDYVAAVVETDDVKVDRVVIDKVDK